MSTSVECDHCRKTAYIPRGKHCPKGWLYLETTNQDDPGDQMITYACTRACADAQWKEGPGPNLDTPQMKATMSVFERHEKMVIASIAPFLMLPSDVSKEEFFLRLQEINKEISQ